MTYHQQRPTTRRDASLDLHAEHAAREDEQEGVGGEGQEPGEEDAERTDDVEEERDDRGANQRAEQINEQVGGASGVELGEGHGEGAREGAAEVEREQGEGCAITTGATNVLVEWSSGEHAVGKDV